VDALVAVAYFVFCIVGIVLTPRMVRSVFTYWTRRGWGPYGRRIEWAAIAFYWIALGILLIGGIYAIVV
jgi:hypothetical protein